MRSQEAMERWKTMLALPGDPWSLEEAAFRYAAAEYPDLGVDEFLEKIDRLAAECEAALGDLPSSPRQRAARLNLHLFERLGFLGNREQYFDPRNSFLNEVIDRKLGIPITLSVLAMAVGDRLGLTFEGVGMPGHFLLRLKGDPVFFDPFAGGHETGIAECHERFRSIYGEQLPWSDRYLDAVPKREILFRMLNNLKLCYRMREDLDRTQRIVEYSLILEPSSTQDRLFLQQLEEWRSRLN